MTNKQIKIFSALLVIREMQITSSVVNHGPPPKWLTLTELTIKPACGTTRILKLLLGV